MTGLINLLVAEEYLTITEGQCPVVRLGGRAVPVLAGKEKVLRRVEKKERAGVADDTTLFELLRKLRKQLSEKQQVPPYVIFHDSTLREMCRLCPVDRPAMLAISGVGENKFEKYGRQFIEVIREHVAGGQK